MQIWTQLGRYEGGLRPRYCLKEKLHGGQRSRQTCRRRGKAQLVFAWLRRNMEFSFHKLQENHYFSSTCKAADKTQSKDHIQIKYIRRCVRCDLRNLIYFLNKNNWSSKLKSYQLTICGERESAPNNRITDKFTVQKRKRRTIFRLKTL